MRVRRRKLTPQPWAWEGPRVLIEDADEERAEARAAAFRRRGYAVAVCSGPTAASRCPLAHDDGCAPATGADLVVSSLGLGTPAARETLVALRLRAAGVPLLVAADIAEVVRRPELVEGCDVVGASATADEVAARAESILAREGRLGA